MKILALDLATTTGWAVHGPKSEDGSWPRDALRWGHIKLSDAVGSRIRELREWLDAKIKSELITHVVYETPGYFPGRVASFRVGCHLEAALLIAAEQALVYGITSGEVKKVATGKGNAKKDQVRASMRGWLLKLGRSTPLATLTDDEADALAVLKSYLVIVERWKP
jgi:Holliday junction resolvasome RuvABC endonuclease subunit